MFTPPQACEFIARWAIRTESDKVLEPSCGEASFLQAASTRLKQLSANPSQTSALVGVEIDSGSISACTDCMYSLGDKWSLHHCDFFDFQSDLMFDAVIGNPPYIRYQRFNGDARIKALKAALANGVSLTGLASSWAAFVVHATKFLKPEGRLGLVLPAELLTVNYASAIRRFLLERFSSVKLITFEERIFEDALEDTVILLAEGSGGTSHLEVYPARNIDSLTTLDPKNWQNVDLVEGGRWANALLPTDTYSFFEEGLDKSGFVSLKQWGETYIGCVTGNNNFFAINRETARKYAIPESDLIGLTPPGSRHLRGLSFDKLAWSELSSKGAKTYLLAPGDCPAAGTLNYIDVGRKEQVDRAYKCKIRKPWFKVPLVQKADLFLTYMDAQRPRLVTNSANVMHLNSLYGVKLHPGLKRLGKNFLSIAAINSLTLLGAELVGRSYGGGMLKLEPREADRLPMPSPDELERHSHTLSDIHHRVAMLVSRNELNAACEIVDKLVLCDMPKSLLKQIREMRECLFQRRKNRSVQ